MISRTSPFVVAVVGASGWFGSHLVRGLLECTEAKVLLCARNKDKLDSLAAELSPEWKSRVQVVAVDRNRVSSPWLQSLNINCLVDASGPFQRIAEEDPFALARSTINAGVHYVDLADSREFVRDFQGELDQLAKERRVVAVTGASSTPATSAAVLQSLASGWNQVDSAEVAIMPGNQAQAGLGLSVTKAILSYCGKKIQMRRFGRWTTGYGWGLTHRRVVPGLGNRWLSLCETPDLDAIPQRFPAIRQALFYAGLELQIFHLGLWLLSLLVRTGIVTSLLPAADALHKVVQNSRRFGSDTGGMMVQICGEDGAQQRVRSTFTLIATRGVGPKLPTLPALCVVQDLMSSKIVESGARSCAGMVSIDDLKPHFQRLGVETRVRNENIPATSIFKQVVDGFDKLPASLQQLHSVAPFGEFAGRGQVHGSSNIVGRIVALVFDFPPSNKDVPVHFTVEQLDGSMIWVRRFGNYEFYSHIRCDANGERNVFYETFGAVTVKLRIEANEQGFALHVQEAALLGIKLPQFLVPATKSRTFADGQGRYNFDVAISMPIVGQIVRYTGWLQPLPREQWGIIKSD